MNDINKKSIIKGTISFALYFILNYLTLVPFKLLGIDYANLNIIIRQIYLLVYNLITITIFLFIYKDELKNEFKDFKKNYKKYFNENIKYWLFALAIMYASNIVIAAIKYNQTGVISTAENEQSIHDILIKAPIYTYISAAFLAPIIEELTFRKSLRKIFNNKYVFIIISSLIFGGLHVLTENAQLIDLLYLIPYCAPGVAFAYILVKTNNIFNSISLHLLHNTILMTLQLIMLMRGML